MSFCTVEEVIVQFEYFGLTGHTTDLQWEPNKSLGNTSYRLLWDSISEIPLAENLSNIFRWLWNIFHVVRSLGILSGNQKTNSFFKMVTRTKKIFVGGLSASTVQADLTSYFSTFGKVEEAMLMFDRQTNRHRGFGFVTFDTEEAVEKVCQLHYHEINNKTVRLSNNIIKTIFIKI